MLNLHGEVPSSAADGVTVMNAEIRFLPVLKDLVGKYPKLKIVLEHCTSADAVEAVRSLHDNVVGTIVSFLPPFTHRVADLPLKTAHHLSLLVDDWSANVVCPRPTPFHPLPVLTTTTAPLLQTLRQVPRGPSCPPQRRRHQQRQILPRHRQCPYVNPFLLPRPLASLHQAANVPRPSPRHHLQKGQRQHRSRCLYPAPCSRLRSSLPPLILWPLSSPSPTPPTSPPPPPLPTVHAPPPPLSNISQPHRSSPPSKKPSPAATSPPTPSPTTS